MEKRELFARKVVCPTDGHEEPVGAEPKYSMYDDTLLLFDWDDSVASVQTIRSKTNDQALQIADVVIRTRPRLAGYQLWQQGQRIAATFPVEKGQPSRALHAATT